MAPEIQVTIYPAHMSQETTSNRNWDKTAYRHNKTKMGGLDQAPRLNAMIVPML